MSQNVTVGSPATSRRPRRRCKSTGGREISDELYEGYLVSDDGKIVGEARRYDPYSKFGDIMLYEVDSFGFVPGFISKGIKLMSEDDLKADKRLRKELEESKYEVWKRHNVIDLISEYDAMFKNRQTFDNFCRQVYRKLL